MDVGVGRSPVTLESRYFEHDTPVLLSGIQALVRILLEQARLDRAAGLQTAGLVSGYRGSPLGGLDQELWRRERLLTAQGVRFQPGLNEDLAATMLWGSQQMASFADRGPRVQGVFGMWYGKGPGVDRSADALRCANTMGAAATGGVVCVAGDDHAAHSSTFPHQTDQIFEAVMMPVLAPADVGDILHLGLAAIALSRFSGCWTALKTIAETAEQARTVTVPSLVSWHRPDFALPPHGLNFDPHLAWPARRTELERRVIEERLPAVLAWAAANRLDRQTQGDATAQFGLVTVGKAWHDTRHALDLLGLGGDPRIGVYRVAMTWPLETEGLRRFAAGKRALLVVEEKRSMVERALRDALYHLPADRRPDVLGKTDASGAPLLPAVLELSPALVARALASALRGAGIAAADPVGREAAPRPDGLLTRGPTFCAGCPHTTSTVVPQGSVALAGIGCHVMALERGPATRTFSHMGGEGVPWLGVAPFLAQPHAFANMGDGTYQHSGLLAIRQAVASGVAITYKILFNDAVAMTGGQPAEGRPSVAAIAHQVAAEGVRRIAVVADDTARLPEAAWLPAGTTRHDRCELDALQQELRGVPGVSVLIYDQVCATEKRRRRKRGTMARPARTVHINPDICENCGDCTAQSGCIAIEPAATAMGRKRRISPTACNTDLSCLKGFCPSFVTSEAAPPTPAPHWAAREEALAAGLVPPVIDRPGELWRGLFAGIGGGGIVTTGAIVAMAAHLDGLCVSTLDFTGLAQKNGAVVAHVQIGGRDPDVVRIADGEAQFLLAADLAVGADPAVLRCCSAGTAVAGNLDLAAGAGFIGQRDLPVDAGLHRRVIAGLAPECIWLRAAAICEHLFGTAQAMNTLLLGAAWQQGRVPVSEGALLRAIALNGTEVALNRRAFLWGRLLAADCALQAQVLEPAPERADPAGRVAAFAAALAAYQDAAYAARYRAFVDHAMAHETRLAGAPGRLSEAVAENYYRLLAYKDEYEVARLHAAADYGKRPVFHLAPPLPVGRDRATGRRRKIAVPGWLALPLFRVLRHGRVLRGTAFDPFGYQRDRRQERALIREYETTLTAAMTSLPLERLVALARWPETIRGFGPVKAASIAQAGKAGGVRRTAPSRGLA